MLEQMQWKDAYKLWKYGCLNFGPSKALDSPMAAETVSVDYDVKGSYFYGFDWLSNEEARSRKKLIQNDPVQFVYFTRPTNKETMQTAEMLIEAQSEEELAAIWIAATGKELSENHAGKGVRRYSDMLYMAACGFLADRYYLWHHAMKRLVPKIELPQSLLESITCKDAEPVMALIQMNMMLLKSTYCILRYSSLPDEKWPESHIRRSE